MSSIDRDPDENNSNSNNRNRNGAKNSMIKLLQELQARTVSKIQQKLPPPPEDQLSLGGDIGCIFLYTFIDHAVNSLYDDYLNSPEVTQVSKSAYAAIESSSAAAASAELSNSAMDVYMDIGMGIGMGMDTNVNANMNMNMGMTFTSNVVSNSFPVWFDSLNSAPFGNIPLSSALPIAHHIQYAPAIGEFGTAAVLLSSTWMLSGYFTRAFLFENTLECDTSRALIVTLQTWIVTSLVMFAVAYGSDVAVGCWDCLHKSIGLTKADEDYILDSLSVLLVWRFTISTFFGYGGGGGGGSNDGGGKDNNGNRKGKDEDTKDERRQ